MFYRYCIFVFSLLFITNFCAIAKKPEIILPITSNFCEAEFSSDNKYVITRDNNDYVFQIWSVRTGKLIKTVIDSTKNLSFINIDFCGNSIAKKRKDSSIISPDKKYYFVIYYDGTARLEETKFKKLIKKLKPMGIMTAQFSSNSEYFLTTHWNYDSVCIWSSINGKLIHTLKGVEDYYPYHACFGSDENMIIVNESNFGGSIYINGRMACGNINFCELKKYFTTFNDSTIFLGTLNNFNNKSIIPPRNSCNKLNFSSDGKYIYNEDYPNSWIFSIQQNRIIIRDHNEIAYPEFIFSPDMKYVLNTYENEKEGWYGTTLYSLEKGKIICDIDQQGYAQFNNDGKYFITRDGEKVIIYLTENGKKIDSLAASDIMAPIQFSSNNKYILTYLDSIAYVWENESFKIKQIIRNNSVYGWGYYNIPLFTPDSKYIVSIETNNDTNFIAKIIDVENGKINKIINCQSYIKNVKFNNDGSNLAFISDDSTIQIWSLEKNIRLYSFKCDFNIDKFLFSSDDKYILCIDKFNISNATFFSLEKNKMIRKFENISSIAISPNNQIIIATFDNPSEGMKVYNIQTGEELIKLIPLDSINWINITPDGFFDASEGALKYVNFVDGLNEFSFEQIKYKLFVSGLYSKVISTIINKK